MLNSLIASLPVAPLSHRERILQQLLENKHGLSIDQLAKFLNISRTAVQKHFLILENEGLIKKHTRQKTMGRPSTAYILTTRGLASFPKQYAHFSEFLMQEMKNELGQDGLASVMQKLGKTLAAQYRPRFTGLTEQEQIQQVVELMQELGFHIKAPPSTESSTFDINAFNCIYHSVAQRFQEICILDQTLVAELLAKPVELKSCMAKGDGYCNLKIHLKGT